MEIDYKNKFLRFNKKYGFEMQIFLYIQFFIVVLKPSVFRFLGGKIERV